MATVAAELLSLHALGRSAPHPFLGHRGCRWLWSLYPPSLVLSALLLQGAWDCSQGFSTPQETASPQITHLAPSSLCSVTVTGSRAMTT